MKQNLKRTNIVLDMAKVKKAKQIAGCRSTREVVEYALNRLLKTTEALAELEKIRDKVQIPPSYDYKDFR